MRQPDGSYEYNLPKLNPRNMFKGGLQRFLDMPQVQSAMQKAASLPITAQIVASQEFRPGSEHRYSFDINDLKQSGMVYEAYANYAVYRDVHLKGSIIAAAVGEVQKRDPGNPEGWNPVIGHPFERIMEERPNPFMGPSEIWIIQVVRRYLYGEAYWLQVPNANGELLQLWPIPPERMRPIPHRTKFISGYWYYAVSDGDPIFLRPDQVVYHAIRNPLPGFYHSGLSPLVALVLGIKLNQGVQVNDFNDVQNGLNINQILSVPQNTGIDQFEMIKRDMVRSVNEGERFRLIRAGELSVSDTSTTPTGAYLKAIREVTEAQIDTVFGIPGDFWNNSANLASKKAATDMVINDAWNLAQVLAEDITAQLIVRWYGDDYRFVFRDFRPKDIELDLKVKSSNREVQTYDEARAEAGLDPHPEPAVGNSPAKVAGEVAKILVQSGHTLDGSAPVPLITETPEPTSESAGEPTGEVEEVEAEEEAESDEDEPESKAQSSEYLSIVKALNEVSGAVLLGEELI